MLQIIGRAACCRIRACAVAPGAFGGAPKVDWLLDDALKEEYVPLAQTAVILPPDYQKAIDIYKTGNYQAAVRVLEGLRDMHLPDGRVDFICFALGESYRMLHLRRPCRGKLPAGCGAFPVERQGAPEHFRLLQYAHSEKTRS